MKILISGTQGSGKSTIAHILKAALAIAPEFAKHRIIIEDGADYRYESAPPSKRPVIEISTECAYVTAAREVLIAKALAFRNQMTAAKIVSLQDAIEAYDEALSAAADRKSI